MNKISKTQLTTLKGGSNIFSDIIKGAGSILNSVFGFASDLGVKIESGVLFSQVDTSHADKITFDASKNSFTVDNTEYNKAQGKLALLEQEQFGVPVLQAPTLM